MKKFNGNTFLLYCLLFFPPKDSKKTKQLVEFGRWWFIWTLWYFILLWQHGVLFSNTSRHAHAGKNDLIQNFLFACVLVRIKTAFSETTNFCLFFNKKKAKNKCEKTRGREMKVLRVLFCCGIFMPCSPTDRQES